MPGFESLLASHGYLLLFAVGFAEFAGLPLASAPLLVLAGAFAARGSLESSATVAAALLAGLAADLCWYALARRRARWALRLACGLSSNPSACAAGLRTRVESLGARSLRAAKLVPGFANLVAPAAGLARVPLAGFLAADLPGLAFWAGVDVGLGWLFAEEIELALAWLESYTRAATGAAALIVVAVVVARLAKLRRHRHLHASAEPVEP